jgi:iron(III) transport system substrate-binding protein
MQGTRIARAWFVSAALAIAGYMFAAPIAQAQEAPALAAITDAKEKARVSALIEAAKKEGGLAWIGVQIEPEHANAILTEFKRYYGLNDAKVEYTYASTGAIVTRVEQLLKAKRNNFDIVWNASWAWYKDLLKRGEIMKYESPNYAAYTLSDKHGMSQKGYWAADAYAFAPIFNTQAIASQIKDFHPTSWNDFVDPRLAGHLCMINVLISTSAAPVVAGVAKVMGDDWLKALGKLKPTLHSKAAQGRDWVGSGEFSATLLNSPKDALSLVKRKLPTKQVFPKEGVVLIPFPAIIMASAPHPATSKLFIDFVHSAHGTQTAMDSGALLFFGRPGVKPKNPDLLPAMEDVKAIPFDWDKDASNAAVKAFRAKATSYGIGSK